MSMILEYLLAGLAAVGLITSAVFAAFAELGWLSYAWAFAVLLTPVGYLLARRFLPSLEFPVRRRMARRAARR